MLSPYQPLQGIQALVLPHLVYRPVVKCSHERLCKTRTSSKYSGTDSPFSADAEPLFDMHSRGNQINIYIS